MVVRLPNKPGGLVVAGVTVPSGAEEPPGDDTFPNRLGCWAFAPVLSVAFGGVVKPLNPPAPAAFPPPKMLPAAGAVAPPPKRDLVPSTSVVAGAPPPNRDLPLSAPVVVVPPPKRVLLLAAAVAVGKLPNKLPLLPEVVVGPPLPKVPTAEAAAEFMLKGDGLEGFVFSCVPLNIPPVEAGPDDGVEETPDPPPKRPPGFDCWLPNSPPEAFEGAPKLNAGVDAEVLELELGCADPNRLGVFPADAPKSGIDGFEGGFDMVNVQASVSEARSCTTYD